MTPRKRPKLWTPQEDAYLRAEYHRLWPDNVAIALGRTPSAVKKRAVIIGVAKRCGGTNHPNTPEARARIGELNARGLTDSEIAGELGMNRHEVSYQRDQMGLPNHGLPSSPRQRRKISEGVKRQCQRLGIEHLNQLRTTAWAAKARELGWPEDLRPRHLQILEALWNHGPMTRPEINKAIGMRWKGSRNSLTSNDPEGTYLAHLAKRGLVMVLPRARQVTGQGKGRSLNVYTIPMHVQPARVSREENSDAA